MKKLLFITLISLCSITAYSQSTTPDDVARSGSIYSSLGIGIPTDVFSPYSIGMGLTGVSNFDQLSASVSNPAHWGLGGYSVGVLTVGLNSYRSADNSGSANSTEFIIENFQVVLPILKGRLGVSVAFTPVTRTGYRVFREGQIQPDPDLSPVQYGTDYIGAGGVSRFEGGLGYRINDNLALGYGASIYISTLQRDVTTFFSSTRFQTLSFDETISGSGFGQRAGLFSRFQNTLREGDEITLGATVNLPVNISSTRSAKSARNVDGQLQFVDVVGGSGLFGDGTIEIPLEFNLGITYNPSRLFGISAEYLYQNWNNAQYSFNPSQEQYYTDRNRIGIGAQFHAYENERSSGFFGNLRYSSGLSYDTGHLKIDGVSVETLMFSAGVGILSPRAASSVDLSFQLGLRGTKSNDLVQETIWGLKLSLNLAELMFIRQRFQ